MSLIFLQACTQSTNKTSETQTNNKKEKTTSAQQTPPKEDNTEKKMGLGLVMFHCM